MGDHPLRGQSEQFVVCTFLKVRHNLSSIWPAVLLPICLVVMCCSDSCQKGWRLLYILTAFYRCSEVLKPFLLKFLRDVCRSPELPKLFCKNYRIFLQCSLLFGSVCGMNYNVHECFQAGRSSKRQLFLFPGGIERHLKIKTCSVALDVIEELCYEMALQRLETMDEYTVFIVTDRGTD
uniref:MyTH4 domain-containing protein n=1 Tax=Sinocyclocheilus grahami TaxID=75366 RepID=A0A672MFI2_SINGR